MKIALAQFYTSNVDYGVYAEKINKFYSERHNYIYHVEKETTKIYSTIGDRHPTWFKPSLILEVFEKYSPDWILFLDIDAVVSDLDFKIEQIIDDNFDILLSDDIGHHSDYNAGVLLLKNTDWTKEFLTKWFKSGEEYTGNDAKELNIGTLSSQHDEMKGVFKQALWHDQTCLTLLSRKEENKNHFKCIHSSILNHRIFNDGNFIFHAYAYGHKPYRTIDIAYRTLIPVDSKNFPKLNLIVYHVYCVGNYLKVVKEQLDRLNSSGLYSWCDKLHINCIKTDGDFNEIENLINTYNKVELHTSIENNYEHKAIKAISDYSRQYNGKVLYFHAKGVSNFYDSLSQKNDSLRKIQGIQIHRDFLEYFLIDNYEKCLDKLNSVDQVGVTNINGWWWGNFWWSNLEDIRLQTEPHFGDRWYYEHWLNSGREKTTKYEMFHHTWNPYYTTLPIEFYKGELNGDIEVVKAEYGTLGIQQDEGQPDLPRVTEDVTSIIKENFLQYSNKAIDIPVNTGTMKCDPYPHVQKYLEITLEIQGNQYFLGINDNMHLNIKF